jgi:hypothetical protein
MARLACRFDDAAGHDRGFPADRLRLVRVEVFQMAKESRISRRPGRRQVTCNKSPPRGGHPS